jgi:hypothetical protein
MSPLYSWCVHALLVSSWHLTKRPSAGELNKHRYIVASQSQPLRARLREIPAVPLIHINRSVMVLEPLSDATTKQKDLVSLAHFST